MRHLVVCCDGTWQTSLTDSNVVRLREALAEFDADGIPQVATYIRGVGTMGTVWNRLTGGLAGVGLSRNVTDAYRWLAREYRPGDRVALFGFSRGAYTARSLTGMIGACGLLDTDGLSDAEIDAAVDRAYRRYRERERDPEDMRWRDGLRFRYDPRRDSGIPVGFVGVWDTVGALGIPAHLGVLNKLDLRERFEFHDVRLDRRIPHARHAIALDEMRGPFAPTLWRDVPPDQDVRQVWFPGDHLDVGGGHRSKDLSDGALVWMLEEASAVAGLRFDKAAVARFAPDPLGVQHPRHTLLSPIVDPVLDVALSPRPRAVPRVDADDPAIDESAWRRQRSSTIAGGPYRPTRTPAVGLSESVPVPASDGWSATGLFLEPGEYRFAADGHWRSLAMRAGPDGRRWVPFGPGELLGGVIDRGEDLYRAAVDDPDATIVGARREQDLPWMSLVGVVANEERDGRGQVVHPHDRIAIGRGCTVRIERPGYLYAYANDAWGFYANNTGAVCLRVTRLRRL